ncbi:MAG TPA: DUF1289 domain-containing protein [Burkholderiales bacterium]
MTRSSTLTQDEVASPCIDVCRMNPASFLCEGCFRTLEEIAAWSSMSDEERRAVLARLPARKPPA